MTDQTEREVLTLRYIESQPDSGPHKPAMPGHIAVERGIEVVARLPIPDGLAPSEPVTLDDVEMPPESLSERIKADSALFFAGVNAASATPRTVTTVETLEDVLPGIELTREFDVTEEDATIIGEYLVGLGYVLTPAIDPDNEALALRVCHARLGHMTPGTYACELCRGDVDRVLDAIKEARHD